MYIHLGSLLIPTYSLMIILGLVLGAGTGIFLVRRFELSTDDFTLLGAYTFLSGFFGAKGLYLWISRNYIQWDQMLNKEYFQAVMSGGFVFCGGLIGGLAGLFLAGRIHKIQVYRYLYTCIPVLPAVHGMGRIGCGLAGCCYGIPYDGWFHMLYRESAGAPLNTPLFPVQYLEAVLNFILAAILIVYILKKGPSPKTLLIYFTGYSVMRFFLEYLRYDSAQRGKWLLFSTSQWISLMSLLLSSGIFVCKFYNLRGKDSND